MSSFPGDDASSRDHETMWLSSPRGEKKEKKKMDEMNKRKKESKNEDLSIIRGAEGVG